MRLPLLAGATVVVFLVGLLIVTGIELFTGGPVLSSHSERSTSVGTLLGSGSQPSTTTEAAPTTAAAESETSEPSSSVSPSKRKGAEASGRAGAEDSATPSATAAPRARNAVPVTPSAPPALLQQ
jgi:hypothetical protein